ncbi:NADPH-dependent F420 reductase [Burkholderia ubonensis]|uniref:NADPH-dependent F420 reductase n=1 Tax=Burkholderia ubonensis TaxID=101571 RepID=UPI00075ED73A|nr:NAD(P)-binding domain-containing protein [Burkholderia ubonensis]AOI72262.1 NADP oxidoreductase [Burkholderia ubonensis]KUZ08182.1 NADP oxidoreductase [Burkholderia ubonensis]KUZ26083.1 NADP oxidoreductase [Burkholderia ubonensis]KUZ30688.1 NADP oxidoreductase [Burkholderia ubonensis]KUZ45152.1 NADP oxidoreductase [Burkholderia ubonensis]
MKIAFLGGGNFGGNLAELLVAAGHDVVVGLRDPGRARPRARYRVASLEEAAAHGDVVVIAVLYQACAEVLPPLAELLAGKIVVDATNALRDDWSPLPLGGDGSAAQQIDRLLPGVRLVKCFNTVFADIMTPERIDRAGHAVTAFIAGDDAEANAAVAEIAASAGFAPLVTGALNNARYLEAMAHLNIQIAVVRGGGTNAGFVYHRVGA